MDTLEAGDLIPGWRPSPAQRFAACANRSERLGPAPEKMQAG
jgi:hypothetical protein